MLTRPNPVYDQHTSFGTRLATLNNNQLVASAPQETVNELEDGCIYVFETSCTTLYPAVSNDVMYTEEDTPSTFRVSDNDFDCTGNGVYIWQTTEPTYGSTMIVSNQLQIKYYPGVPDYFGTDSFTYVVTEHGAIPPEEKMRTGTVHVVITPVNDAPVAVSSNFYINEDTICSNVLSGTDVDDTELIYLSYSPPSHGNVTIQLDGTFVYTPELNYYGTDTFAFVVADSNLLFDIGTATVHISGINDPPNSRTAIRDSTDESTDYQSTFSL